MLSIPTIQLILITKLRSLQFNNLIKFDKFDAKYNYK